MSQDWLNDIEDAEDEVEDPMENVEVPEEAEEAAVDPEEDDVAETPSEDAEEDPEENETQPSEVGEETAHNDTEVSSRPDIDVSKLAPQAKSREQMVEEGDDQRSLLVWGPEGTGKTHVAHTAPEPVCIIDTEGKAHDIAEKFDKEIYYFQAEDYQEAVDALRQAEKVLDAFLQEGIRGTLVVDSMTKMWDYAKQDYAEFAYPGQDPDTVDFSSALEGEDDWKLIKRRHNKKFRSRILENDFHVVFTSGEKEDYNRKIEEGLGYTPMKPDGERWNKYAVRDVVRLYRDDEGKTVANLRKSSLSRNAFVGMPWPTWDKIYEALDRIVKAETSDEDVDVTSWEYDIVEGQPQQGSPGDEDE